MKVLPDRGGSATSVITVTAAGGFNQSVALTAVCPTGATCLFSPKSVTPTGAAAANSTLTVVPSDTTPSSSAVVIVGTSGALSASTSVALNAQAAPKSVQTSTGGISDTLKNNFGFGVALGLATNVTGPNIVNSATVDANGIVRVNTRANTSAGVLLETHYFIWPQPSNGAKAGATDDRWWGTGPFVAAQPGSSQIISAVGAGWMIGFRRPKGSSPGGFGLGAGYEAIPAAQVLGAEFVDGKPAPVGPTGQPLPIRYETQDKGAVLVVLSVTF